MPPDPIPSAFDNLLKAFRTADGKGSRGIDHQILGHAANIDLIVKALHRRPAEMPGDPAGRGAAADEFVGEMVIEIEHRIELGVGDIGPGLAERAHALFHRAEHKAGLVAHAFG